MTETTIQTENINTQLHKMIRHKPVFSSWWPKPATRSSAVAERPRDVPYRWKFC